MQRIPMRNLPPGNAPQGEDTSPLLKLARRIREEQGAEQVREFFIAMTPFVAPGELRFAAAGFGIEPEALSRGAQRKEANEGPKKQAANRGPDPMDLIGMMMRLKGMGGQTMDPMKLIEMLNTK